MFASRLASLTGSVYEWAMPDKKPKTSICGDPKGPQ